MSKKIIIIEQAKKEAEKLLKKLKKNQILFSDPLQPIIEKQFNLFRNNIRAFESMLKGQTDIYDEITKPLKNIPLDKMNALFRLPRLLENVVISWEKFDKKQKKANRILKKYRWFITLDMPITIISKIVKIDNEGNSSVKNYNKLFVTYFTSDNWKKTELMIRKWQKSQSIKKTRMKIIKDCFEVSRMKKYRVNMALVVIPTLITQIEGIIKDYLTKKNPELKKGRLPSKKMKEKFIELKDDGLAGEYSKLVDYLLIDYLFQHSVERQPLVTPFYYNRHKILHGENTDYGRVAYLVRTFMIIDYLSHLK